ncbi:MAG: cupredoxin domain-containing protein [Candidatus Micrarchaeota archaeon]
MNKTSFVLLALTTVLLFGCVEQTPSGTQPSPALAREASVVIGGNHFEPTEITIAAGGTIVWTNADNEAHDVEFENGVASPLLQPNESWTHSFNEKGVFAYHCSIHELNNGYLGEGVVNVK